MVESMRDHATPVTLTVDAVDTCGTGGDGARTFNISTGAALVVAGAGCPVAKHGNRAQSSQCGSADVLEALGVAIALPAAGVQRCIEEAGIGFFFAPTYHPAMRHAAAPRRELGIRTVFNVLGPLANPARVRRQALGVADPAMAPKMGEVLRRLGHRRALVFTGPDGIDELGLSSVAHCWDVTPEQVREYDVDPAALGFSPAPLSALRGGDAASNAECIRSVLRGEPGAARDVVVLNAAAALVAAGRAEDLAAGIAPAQESIDSGAAAERLDALVRVSTQAAR
jgi:anthranilate phosphoribosyltransferase